MPEYRLTLPVPPSVNHIYDVVPRRSPRGYYAGRQLKASVRLYRQVVMAEVLQQGRPAIAPDACLHITVCLFLAGRDQDLDNSFKAVLDALACALSFNDRQVVELHGYKGADKENPRVEILIAWNKHMRGRNQDVE